MMNTEEKWTHAYLTVGLCVGIAIVPLLTWQCTADRESKTGDAIRHDVAETARNGENNLARARQSRAEWIANCFSRGGMYPRGEVPDRDECVGLADRAFGPDPAGPASQNQVALPAVLKGLP
jgi:hypothetical protein